MFISHDIIELLRVNCPDSTKFYPLHEPTFAGNEIKYTNDCIATGWVSSAGKYVDLFEEKLAEFIGAKKAIAVSNGTAALHICLLLAGVSEGDEVLCPALTFIATANAISYCFATPHFVDSEYKTLGVDPKKLKEYLEGIAQIKGNECFNKNTGKRIKALVVMHTFGHAVDLDPIVDICKEYKITLIEDAAESLGSKYKGIHTGNYGLISSLSFNGNKTITTGGGGAIITNDEALGKLAKHMTTTAKIAHKWEFYHDMVGYNYRMPNLNAALGVAQMEILPDLLAKKKIVAKNYEVVFSGFEGAEFFIKPEFSDSNYWLNLILLSRGNIPERDNVLEATNTAGIMTRPAWMLMQKLPMYKDCPHDDLSVAEDLEQRLINIPSSPNLANDTK
jgi:perosamine synthetase